MRKPKVVLIDDDYMTRKLIEETFQRTISPRTGIDFELKTYERCPDNIDEIKDSDLYLLDLGLKEGMQGDQIARKLKESGSTAPRMLVTGAIFVGDEAKEEDETVFSSVNGDREKYKSRLNNGDLLRWLNEGLFDIVIQKKSQGSSLIKGLTRNICALRDNQRLVIPLNVGIVGLGKLGRESLERAVEQPWVKSAGIYSAHYTTNDPNTFKGFGKTIHSDKIKLNWRLEDLVAGKPDVLFIATGLSFDAKRTRDQLFYETAPKVYPIFEQVVKQNYDGLVIMGSNPLGTLLMLGSEMDIPRHHLVGESVTDAIRARKLLAEEEYVGPDVHEGDVQIEVLGNHSEPVPILSRAKIKGRPLTEIRGIKEFRDQFTETLRKMGREIMKYAEKTQTYSDAPQGFMEMIKDVAHLSRVPHSCWMVYDAKIHQYTNLPVKAIEYPSLRVCSGGVPEGLDDWEKERLAKQTVENYKSQKRAVKFLAGKMEENK